MPLLKRKAESECGDLEVVPAGGKLAKAESSSGEAPARSTFDPRSFILESMKADPKCSEGMLTQARMQHLYARAIESLTPQQMFALGQELKHHLIAADGTAQPAEVFDPLVRELVLAHRKNEFYAGEDPHLKTLPMALELLRGLSQALNPDVSREEFIGMLLNRGNQPAAHEAATAIPGLHVESGKWITEDRALSLVIELACQLMPRQERGSGGQELLLSKLIANRRSDYAKKILLHSPDVSYQRCYADAFIHAAPNEQLSIVDANRILQFVLREAGDCNLMGWMIALVKSGCFRATDVPVLLKRIAAEPHLPACDRGAAASIVAAQWCPHEGENADDRFGDCFERDLDLNVDLGEVFGFIKSNAKALKPAEISRLVVGLKAFWKSQGLQSTSGKDWDALVAIVAWGTPSSSAIDGPPTAAQSETLGPQFRQEHPLPATQAQQATPLESAVDLQAQAPATSLS